MTKDNIISILQMAEVELKAMYKRVGIQNSNVLRAVQDASAAMMADQFRQAAVSGSLPLSDIKKLCNIIVNSHPDTMIKGEIESMALEIAHNQTILNHDGNDINVIVALPLTKEDVTECIMDAYQRGVDFIIDNI